MKIKVSDYIANFLVAHEIQHVFTVTGGGAMHLNDSLGHHKKLACIYNHHEQACAIAAEGYTRLSGKLAAVCVTSGPGGTNAITGVLGGWLDSIAMFIVSGQVKKETTIQSTNLPLRQLGDQEFNIIDAVKCMTKYAVMITDPTTIRYHLEKALYLAINGRPGPIWLDIPLDVQAAMVEVDQLSAFDARSEEIKPSPKITKTQINHVIEKLKKAKRPILYIGTGIHLSKSEEKLRIFVESYKIPVVAGFNAHDCFTYEHPLYIGRPGTIGDRAGNYAVQNSDCLLILGCRLSIRQIGYSFESFAREAYKIMIDIDKAELEKPTLQIDYPIHGDVSVFLDLLFEKIPYELPSYKGWIDWCIERKYKYPVVLPEYYDQKNAVNPYCFMEILGKQTEIAQVMVASNATACICSFQGIKIKEKQRLFSNSGSASMGYGLPAAIGAAMATNKKKVLCFEGDGSLQMNIQELQTVVHYKIPLKLFYLNNQGYHSIRETQTNFFEPPLVGCTVVGGVSFPDIKKIAHAYGIKFIRCHHHLELEKNIALALDGNEPCICEVILTTKQAFSPRSSSKKLTNGKMVSRPLEDLAPFLERDEYLSNMIIKTVEQNEKEKAHD